MPQANTAQSSAEQRRHPRLPCEIEVSLQSEHNFYTGFTQNLSEGGIFVATEALCEAGTELDFEFTLAPDPNPVKVRGIVRWIREANAYTTDVPAGMGIEFIAIDDETRARIDDFIARKRESIFFV